MRVFFPSSPKPQKSSRSWRCKLSFGLVCLPCALSVLREIQGTILDRRKSSLVVQKWVAVCPMAFFAANTVPSSAAAATRGAQRHAAALGALPPRPRSGAARQSSTTFLPVRPAAGDFPSASLHAA